MRQDFDAIIIGAGQAGPSLAGRLTQAGWKVAFVERKLFGGTCVNVGCTPTKAMVASAHAAHIARRGNDFGVVRHEPVSVDMKKVLARKNAIVMKSRTGVESWLRGMERCTVFTGTARFESPNEIRVGEEVLHAKNIFLNVGARPAVPNMPGVGDVPFLTSTTILDLDELPQHLIVIGGSYVGLEFAQMYRRFGAEVTVVERKSRLVPNEDEDISSGVREILQSEGIQLRLDANCIQLENNGGEVAVGLDCLEGHPKVVGTRILLAVGRQPNTDDLGLSAAGVQTDERGYITVDDELRTSVSGIWALGDCNGRGAFTHTSYNDFEIVADNLLENGSRRVSDRIPVSALYIDPPLAQVGLTEKQVRESGRPALIGTRPMTKVGRAVEKGESQGFMKVLVDAESKKILGASILGSGGDEAIHCILSTMYAGAPYSTLSHAVNIHPTVSELIPTMLQSMTPLG
ncbi:FAD-containing oxidoreductase [Tunturibacter empetritectus]|uniref:Pyruvate/2-oxoglutarate dehydrogenase complex dihydrolipoamide dehydrogenase (E3) component n=2 Tax=Tunturiibacter empetritectus TaxID=3069691 RepID=A0A7W8MSY8_9BACT|nr:FAD-containing oxidoreductase [Edaphobacter lichenicola]MBB5317654.1 pyruvate/2-oxoglutarate dehydrogenase complex dihydrolipoamide dehydrogenase (E3) component [Edaphobacter lichenicola]